MLSKQNSLNDICNLTEWNFYQKTKEYNDTLTLIKNDNGFILPYFNEVFVRTENYLKQNSS